MRGEIGVLEGEGEEQRPRAAPFEGPQQRRVSAGQHAAPVRGERKRAGDPHGAQVHELQHGIGPVPRPELGTAHLARGGDRKVRRHGRDQQIISGRHRTGSDAVEDHDAVGAPGRRIQAPGRGGAGDREDAQETLEIRIAFAHQEDRGQRGRVEHRGGDIVLRYRVVGGDAGPELPGAGDREDHRPAPAPRHVYGIAIHRHPVVAHVQRHPAGPVVEVVQPEQRFGSTGVSRDAKGGDRDVVGGGPQDPIRRVGEGGQSLARRVRPDHDPPAARQRKLRRREHRAPEIPRGVPRFERPERRDQRGVIPGQGKDHLRPGTRRHNTGPLARPQVGYKVERLIPRAIEPGRGTIARPHRERKIQDQDQVAPLHPAHDRGRPGEGDDDRGGGKDLEQKQQAALDPPRRPVGRQGRGGPLPQEDAAHGVLPASHPQEVQENQERDGEQAPQRRRRADAHWSSPPWRSQRRTSVSTGTAVEVLR